MKKILLFLISLLFLNPVYSQLQQKYFNANQYLTTIFFTDSLNGWVGGYEHNGNCFILKTTNGGDSWTPATYKEFLLLFILQTKIQVTVPPITEFTKL
jgi:hypothetical protein